jgi:hypothetical protein
MGMAFTKIEPERMQVLEEWLKELRGESSPEARALDDDNVERNDAASGNEPKYVLNERIVALIRKRVLTDREGNALLKKFDAVIGGRRVASRGEMRLRRCGPARSQNLQSRGLHPGEREHGSAVPLQVRGIERFREEIAHLQDFGFAFQVGEDYRDVAAKFPDQLATGAAGWRQNVGIGDDGDGVEAALAFADGLENGGAFGADGQAIGSIFHVTAAEDAAGSGAKGGPDSKIGVGSVSVFARLFGDED